MSLSHAPNSPLQSRWEALRPRRVCVTQNSVDLGPNILTVLIKFVLRPL